MHCFHIRPWLTEEDYVYTPVHVVGCASIIRNSVVNQCERIVLTAPAATIERQVSFFNYRMALSMPHTTAKADDVAKLLLVSNKQIPGNASHSLPCGIRRCRHLIVTLIVTKRDPDYHQHATVSSIH